MPALPEIIGASPAIVALRDSATRLLERSAATRRLPPVLILGETGTGKGLLARAIQRAGPRAAGSFVEVNCAAIPENLLESEMFGVERGAFTDARQAKPGLFQTAHAGTLFLDEVGLLPEALQGKLLKAIEDRVVRRVGSTRTEPADTWVVSATSVDLQGAVQARRFREDLYHRLAVFTLVVPPLRTRGEDVVFLAEHFVAHSCADYGLPSKTLSPDARAALLAHRWPGNVRELANVIERAVLLSDADRIDGDALGLGGRAESAPESPVADGPATLEETVGRAERDYLRAALDRMGWNITRTAAELGISRDTLRYRIEKHGLRRDTTAPPVSRGARPRRTARTEPSSEPVIPVDAPSGGEAIGQAPLPRATPWVRRRLAFLRVAIVTGDAEREPSTVDTERLVEKVEGFGGRVEEMGASSLLAVFGLEVVEDAPRRALDTALAIRTAMARVPSDDGGRSRARIAIHVMTTSVKETPRGPAIDLDAKRAAWQAAEDLVALAAPGEIVVSEAVVPFLLRLFEIAAVDSAAPSGVRAYRLTGRERPDIEVGRHVSPFVGRGRELGLLVSALDAAVQGRGQTIGIVGEAGLGKSRLVRELRVQTAGREIEWLQARCVSYAAGMPFLPLRLMARAACGIEEGDDATTVAKKARMALAQRSLDQRGLAPALLNFLGSAEGSDELSGLSPEALRARVSTGLIELTIELSRLRPLVLVVEDLHWIDPASEAWLDLLTEQVRRAPMLFLSTYRPGYRPPWATRSDAAQIALPPLGRQESRVVVESLLPAGTDSEIGERIVDRAEGNPFFLEELARSVGPGTAVADAVPVTIEDVLHARIDRIPAGPRRLLECAAVLGRAAPAALLRTLWDGDDAPDAHVRELARREVLDEHGRGEGTTYVFRHALLHDVVYRALPPVRREALHRAAATALERSRPGADEEFVDQLAFHWSRAGVADKAVDYLSRLGARSARIYAHAEAVAALAEAIAHAERLGPDDRDREVLALALRQAHSMYFLGRFADIVSLLGHHRERLARPDDAALTGLYHFWLALSWSLMGDTGLTAEHGRLALEAAQRAGDDGIVGKAVYALAYGCFWTGRPAEGIARAREAIAHLERAGDTWWAGHSSWVLGINHMLAGEFDAALAAQRRARAVGEEIGDPRLRSIGTASLGACYALMGEGDLGIENCRRGVELTADPVNTAVTTGFLGGAYLEKGDVGPAIEVLEQAVDLCTKLGGERETTAWFTALLADARLLNGQRDEAQALARNALGRLTTYAYGIAWTERVLGRVALAAGALAECARWLERALASFTRIEARHEVARTHLDLARLAIRDGRPERAAEYLREALGRFEALRIPRYVERCHKLAVDLGVPPL